MSRGHSLGSRYRLNKIDLFESLQMCGAAVDHEAAVKITGFVWANGMDMSLIAFDIMEEDPELDIFGLE